MQTISHTTALQEVLENLHEDLDVVDQVERSYIAVSSAFLTTLTMQFMDKPGEAKLTINVSST